MKTYEIWTREECKTEIKGVPVDTFEGTEAEAVKWLESVAAEDPCAFVEEVADLDSSTMAGGYELYEDGATDEDGDVWEIAYVEVARWK